MDIEVIIDQGRIWCETVIDEAEIKDGQLLINTSLWRWNCYNLFFILSFLGSNMRSGSLARAQTNTRKYAVNEHNFKTTVYICSLDAQFQRQAPVEQIYTYTTNKGACDVYVVYIHDHAQFDWLLWHILLASFVLDSFVTHPSALTSSYTIHPHLRLTSPLTPSWRLLTHVIWMLLYTNLLESLIKSQHPL